MKKFLSGLFTVIFMALAFSVFAQDSTGAGDSGGGLQLNETTIAILGAILGVYEILVRLVPTAKNWSLLGWVIKLIQLVIPNRATPSAKLAAKAKADDPSKPDPPALP